MWRIIIVTSWNARVLTRTTKTYNKVCARGVHKISVNVDEIQFTMNESWFGVDELWVVVDRPRKEKSFFMG